MNPFHLLRIYISRDVWAFVDHQHLFPFFHRFPGKYGAVQTGSYYNIIICFHFLFSCFLRFFRFHLADASSIRTSRIAYHCTVPPRGGKQQTAAQAAAALAQAAKVLPKPADGPLLVALDGRCAAGKTTIAAQMARQYGWGVVHLDDFFLQPIQRTPQRMAEPGGNLDRERLIAEVSHSFLDRFF